RRGCRTAEQIVAETGIAGDDGVGERRDGTGAEDVYAATGIFRLIAGHRRVVEREGVVAEAVESAAKPGVIAGQGRIGQRRGGIFACIKSAAASLIAGIFCHAGIGQRQRRVATGANAAAASQAIVAGDGRIGQRDRGVAPGVNAAALVEAFAVLHRGAVEAQAVAGIDEDVAAGCAAGVPVLDDEAVERRRNRGAARTKDFEHAAGRVVGARGGIGRNRNVRRAVAVDVAVDGDVAADVELALGQIERAARQALGERDGVAVGRILGLAGGTLYLTQG